MKRPKIICTLGTTTDSREVLEEMVKYGLDCGRMNTAYATIDDYQRRLDLLRDVGSIDVMMDIKGPQVRLSADRAYHVQQGDRLLMGFADEPIHFSHNFYRDVSKGDKLYIENGTIEAVVHDKGQKSIDVEIVDPGEGVIHKQMGVNLPGKYLNVPKLSRKDLRVVDFSVRNNVEYIALSFVRDYADVANLQRAIDYFKKKHDSDQDIGIVAKIEDRYGIDNLQSMIEQSRKDGVSLSVMVARGDMFVELPVEEMPFAQESIITTCNDEGVFVITATGVLESMQYNGRPTRAEVCDVYNALAQGTDAFMFSGETSNSHDPAGAVWQLRSIIDKYMVRYQSEVEK